MLLLPVPCTAETFAPTCVHQLLAVKLAQPSQVTHHDEHPCRVLVACLTPIALELCHVSDLRWKVGQSMDDPQGRLA